VAYHPSSRAGYLAVGPASPRTLGLAIDPGGVSMFDHVVFSVSNYEEAKAFFVKALAPLGVEVVSAA
jgi:hypothetical protein